MSTLTIEPGQTPPIDLSATPRIPLARLVRVELRKMADTRSGTWLLIGIGVITMLVIGVFYATADQSDRTFFNFMAATNGPQGLLLPVLGILLVTSEWSQRTALVSFTLSPVRSRVLVAKVLGGLIAGMAAMALTVVVAVLATVVGGAESAWAQVGVDDLGKFVLLQATGILQGLAFGLFFLNSSAAIVSYFALPTALNIVGSFWAELREVQPWIDLWSSQTPLFLGGNLTGEQWAQCVTSTVIWVVLPFAIGFVRVLRAEVK